MSEHPICFAPYKGKLCAVHLVPCKDTLPVNHTEPKPLTEQDPESFPEWFKDWSLKLGPSCEFLEALYSGLRAEGEQG